MNRMMAAGVAIMLGDSLVRQARINAVDGPERWREWRLIQQAR